MEGVRRKTGERGGFREVRRIKEMMGGKKRAKYERLLSNSSSKHKRLIVSGQSKL